ncbi:MAG: biotin synthase BioB [Lentisphaeria bacterium]
MIQETTLLKNIHPLILDAYKILSGQELSRPEILALAAEIQGEDLMDLLSLAHKVKNKYSTESIPCSIINAKSGLCSENCRYCAQSAAHHCDIKKYDLLSAEDVLADARKVYATGVRRYGYVTSGFGYLKNTHEFTQILETLDLLHREMPDLQICAALGILSRETAALLAEHHLYRYNMNLQTNPARYAELVATTHTIEDKIQTIKYVQEFGITNCTGGIIGLGENWEDRIDMAFAVKKLGVEGMTVNVLLPIPGTKLENQPTMHPFEVAKAFALFRLIYPRVMIKFAAGRETLMKDFQGLLMLAGASSLMTGGYLTTRGRTVAEDDLLREQLTAFGEH